MTNNAAVLMRSKQTIEKLMRERVMKGLNDFAMRWLADALSLRKGWLGFTGNLPTSYAVGIWDFDGKLTIHFAQEVDGDYNIFTVLRQKVRKGERAYLQYPWEGEGRVTVGSVDVTQAWGPHLAESYLKSYKPNTYPSVCICTGAEYAEYLERTRSGANVLSESGDPQYVTRLVEAAFRGNEIVTI